MLITDGSKSVGAAFQATTAPSTLELSAVSITGSELMALQSLLPSGDAVLSGWDFPARGGLCGNSVYLSLFAERRA